MLLQILKLRRNQRNPLKTPFCVYKTSCLFHIHIFNTQLALEILSNPFVSHLLLGLTASNYYVLPYFCANRGGFYRLTQIGAISKYGKDQKT